MASYTITTTEDQEAALVYAYNNRVIAPQLPGIIGSLPGTGQLPGIGDKPGPGTQATVPVLPTPITQAEFLQEQVDIWTLNPMISTLLRDINNALVYSLATIPEENRPAALAQIGVIINAQGGTVIREGEAPKFPPPGTRPQQLPPPLVQLPANIPFPNPMIPAGAK